MITILNELNKLSFTLAPIFYKLLYMSLAALCIGVVIILLRRFADKRISPFWKRAMWILALICLAVPYRPQSNTALLNNVEQVQSLSFRENYDQVKIERHDYLAVNELTAENQAEFEKLQKDEQTAYWKSLVFDAALPLLWLFGLAVITILSVAGRIRLAYMLNKNKIGVNERYFTLLEKCKKRLGIKTKVDVIMQSYIGSPALLGVISPTIILPSFINDMDDDKVEYILLHELAHYKRLDMLYNYLLIALQAVYWFNPLIWVMFRFIRQDMELANDAYVLKHIGNENEKRYSASLVEVLARYNNIPLVPKLLCMVDGKENMERRIKMLKLGEKFKKRRFVIALGSIIVIGITAAVFLTTAGDTKPNEPPEVTITADGQEIDYFVSKNKWNGNIYDRLGAYQYAFMQNPDMNNLPVIPSNATINIDFGDYRPDKISVFYDYLEITDKTTPHLNMINEMAPRKMNNGKQYSFTFYPNESAVFSDIIVGRVYKITVSFGDNECEYAFVTADTLDFSNLYSGKTPYIGDNSKVAKVVDNLDLSKSEFSNLFRSGIELQTSNEPFGIYITYEANNDQYDFYEKNTGEGLMGNRDIFMANAAVLFSLIDNLEFVNFYIQVAGQPNPSQYSRHYKRDMFDAIFETDVRRFSETKESFAKFMSELYTVYFPEAQYYRNSGRFFSVSMNVQNADSSGVKAVFENASDNEYTYGEDYKLFVLKDGAWEAVPYVIENWGFDDIGYTLAPNSTSDVMTIDWRWLYGELQDGAYKIQKKVLLVRSPGDYSTYNLEAIFTILSSEDKNNPEQQTAITFWVKPDEPAQVIGEVAAGQWLNSYKNSNISNLQRIEDYAIDKVAVFSGTPLPGQTWQDMEYNLIIRVDYGITTASAEYLSPGDGVSGKGTFDGLFRELYVKALGDGKFEIVGVGTGGGEQEFASTINPNDNSDNVNNNINDDNVKYKTENDFLYSSEGVQFRATAYGAAKALLSADADELALYMIEPNESVSAIRGLVNVFDDIAVINLKFNLENSMVSSDEIRASYEYALKGEDSWSYVTMSLIKTEGEWKVDWLGIEK